MEVLNKNSQYPTNTSLILGYFDGAHAGHRDVILSAVEFAKKNNTKSVLITFNPSPAEYFSKNHKLIFSREHSYELIKNLGVNFIYELDFTKFVNIDAEDYLRNFLIKNFQPISISTGFNHTFGTNKSGDPNLLKKISKEYEYTYFCTGARLENNEVVSSTLIKQYLEKGDLEHANKLLKSTFTISSTVISGQQLGRKIGFPTANLNYPENIVKLPFGVYVVETLNQKVILNWGRKPTVGDYHPILELHIPNKEIDLYGKKLNIKILRKIRDEIKFNSIDELVSQISKDIEECLK